MDVVISWHDLYAWKKLNEREFIMNTNIDGNYTLAKRINAMQLAWNDEVHIVNVSLRIATEFAILALSLSSAYRNFYK